MLTIFGHSWKRGNDARKWIYVERDPEAMGVNRPIDVPLVGDLRDVVPQLSAALAGPGRALSPNLADWAARRDADKQAIDDSVPRTSMPIHPGLVPIETTKVVPDDSILIRP